MAEKKEKQEIEREYNVPLRKEFMKVPRGKRTNKAVRALKEFIIKHMKSENVSISKATNEKLWGKGIRNPPHHVKVKVKKDSDGKVMVTLPDEKEKEKKISEKAAKKGKKEKQEKKESDEAKELKEKKVEKVENKEKVEKVEKAEKTEKKPAKEEKPKAEEAKK